MKEAITAFFKALSDSDRQTGNRKNDDCKGTWIYISATIHPDTIALCAPTGRAAKRLSELAQRQRRFTPC